MLRRDFLTKRSHNHRELQSRAGGIKRKLLICLALLAIIIALLPTIIAKTPLRNSLLSAAVPGNSMRVSIGGASLSWISGPVLSGVQLNDSASNPLLTADAITIDRTPLSLLANFHDCGIIAINRPQIFLKLRPDGSNLEDTFQQLLSEIAAKATPAPDRSSGHAPFLYALQVVDGTINIEDAATGRASRIDHVNLQYDCHGAAGGLGNGSLAGQLAVAGPNGSAFPAGRFALMLKPNGNRHELSLQADSVALATLQPLLNRFVPGTQVAGTLAGSGSASWVDTANAPSDFITTGTFAIDQIEAVSPVLSNDHIRLSRVELPWRIAAEPAGLSIEELGIKTDVGQIAAHGRIDPAILSAIQNANTLPLLLNGNNDIELKGAIDLARLAAMIPRALRIRTDTTITSGSIELAGRVQPTANGQSITGSIRTAQLAATSGGRPLSWDDPVSANVAVTRASSAFALDKLQCDSKFLHVQASGTMQKLDAEATFDLNSLADQLSKFVDLSHIQLAGTGNTQLAWQQVEGNKFSATVKSELSQLRVALNDGAVWSEPQLEVRAAATGVLDAVSHQPTQVEAAQLQVNGQGDQLEARLAGAVALTNNNTAWPIAVHATGSIARWLTRAKPWLTTAGWQIDGASEITANVLASNSQLDVTDSKITVNNLQASSPGWTVNEPRLEFAGDAHINRATGEIIANSTQLVTSTVSVVAKDLHFASGEHGIAQLTGVTAFRADVARLASWRAPTNDPTQYLPSGEFTGNIRFAQQSGHITGEVSATGQNLGLTSTARRGSAAPGTPPAAGANTQIIWQEPRLIVHALTNYDSSADRATFDQFQIQSNTLQASASGQVDRVTTAAQCNINGALNYDLDQLSPLLRPYIGEGIQLNGREQARFAVAGQLLDSSGSPAVKLQPVSYAGQPPAPNPQSPSWSRRIHAQLELPWNGANVYGLPVGPGKLAATLGNGALQIAPIALTVGEGRLNLAPNIRFDPEPAELTMPAGPVITNVHISPEVSEAMLKYVAPVLSGATQSEGQFSLQIDGLRAPLADTKKAASSGMLTVHSVRVVPGPNTEQFVGLAQQIQALIKRTDAQTSHTTTLLQIRDQQVNFKVADGRVYHQNIEFQIGEVVMRSQGSVGLTDETISLTLQIPVQDDWVAKNPILAGLKGQTLQIPVSGTLKQPQMDKRALTNISGQLIQNAAGSQINKALDKFLKPRQ